MRAGHASHEFGRSGPPASLSSAVSCSGIMITRSIAASLLLALAITGCRTSKQSPVLSGEPGAIDANRDLAKGILALENIGSPTLIPWEYVEVLQQKYGIKVHLVAFDVHSDEQWQHVKAYNAVMLDEIERRFGEGVWNTILEEGAKVHEHKRPANAGN